MDPFVYLIVFLLAVVFVVLLPIVGGIGSYSVDRKARSSEVQGDGKAKSLRSYTELKKEDAPVKFKVGSSKEGKGFGGQKFDIDSKTGLKKRVIGKYKKNENAFDYDVDELIAEDLEEQQQEEAARYAQLLGKENETLEHLA
ncbi:unnamed protein product [Kluyveromyces dobzhanskii CBS 2104]|uniref:WGS project CCBQ000000000 data, contig 00017 n=1 Tax=Kluyveromyces dobzhanskii CBS 2104 TaxID=1427455 RepID=A0A0A8L687_9SACH|nr:unnamed protein product [Kluyveromyces dobzhanskii CBS 2104]